MNENRGSHELLGHTVKDGVKGWKLPQLWMLSNKWSLYDVILSQQLLCQILGITIQYNTVQKALKLLSVVILVWPIFSVCFNPLKPVSNSYCWYTITKLIQWINISALNDNYYWRIRMRPQLTKCKKINQNCCGQSLSFSTLTAWQHNPHQLNLI